MKRIFIISICLLVAIGWSSAQTLTITQDFEKIQFASVMVLYKNLFGKHEKPDLDRNFPYALLRVGLEGDAHEVKAAKQQLNLYLGQTVAVQDIHKSNSNEILFLIPSRARMIYMDCGDGCERKLLFEMPDLDDDAVYYGKVHFVPAETDDERDSQIDELTNRLKELEMQLSQQQANTSAATSPLYEEEQKEDVAAVVEEIEVAEEVEEAKEEEEVKIVIDLSGVHNGYEYVDMGLSVKWATLNIGAQQPEGYGHYYAWGEQEERNSYTWTTYSHCTGSYLNMTKYVVQSNTSSNFGAVDHIQTLELVDDVANTEWGGDWRMPTNEEWYELAVSCTWVWTSRNGINGYEVIADNGNSIFLPAAGSKNYSTLFNANACGYYWSSSLYEAKANNAYHLYFDSTTGNTTYRYRYYGHTIRAVYPK